MVVHVVEAVEVGQEGGSGSQSVGSLFYVLADAVAVFGELADGRSGRELQGDRNTVEIHVHCESPDGIIVSVGLLEGVDDYPNNWFTFSVKHLAPISLTFLMPPSYPSHHHPYFTLGVEWLDSVNFPSLLDLIWAQQPEQEVVF